MLQLILGRSGSGKTFLIREELAALAASGQKAPLILLVPEQFSFESERSLLERLGPRLAGQIQVLSFTRLAETVFRELGGAAGPAMDDVTRVLLVSQAMEQIAGELVLYRRQAVSPDYIQSVLSTLSECKQCAITPSLLEETGRHVEDGTLRQKTRELSLILEAYEALAGQSRLDPLDSLTRLARQLPQSRRLDGALVYIDSFKGFTLQEQQVLAVLMTKASRMTVALCANAAEDEEGGYGLFSPVIRTAARLRSIAYERQVPVAKIRYLTENHRTVDAALRALEAGMFTPQAAVYEGGASAVTLAACGDIYAECAWTARTIRRLLREEKGRCRDFAVVARNLPDYEGVLDAAMEQAGVPYYMDQRDDILTEPLITLVLSALRAVTEGFDSEEMLRLAKTGLLPGFHTENTAEMENYIYMWRIRGNRWKENWDWNPLGLSVRRDEESDALLAQLNQQREALMEPLLWLQHALADGKTDGRTFAEAVYRYLLRVQADEAVRARVAALEEAGEQALADRAGRIWDILMDLLSRYAAALGEMRLSPARHLELFRLVAGTADLGSIPQSLDAVQIGSADRMRFSAPKTVFILGANEGVFPAYPEGAGLLSDSERRALIAAGLPMADAADLQAVEERFFVYTALSAPSKRLYISYLKGNAAGETLAPSSFIEGVLRILPGCRQETPGDTGEDDIESEADAFAYLAASWPTPTPASAALRRYFEEKAEQRPRLAAMARAANRRPAALADEALAKRFFGTDMRLSPSRVEKYHLCRFAYFCQYGIKARVRRPADLDAAEFGTLSHYVMETQLKAYMQEGTALGSLPKARVLADAAARVKQYADETMGGMEDKPERFAWLMERLIKTCGSLLWQVVRELAQSRFVPAAFELAIGGEAEERVEPLILTLPDGAKIQVQGQVDRVDVYEKDGVSYVRVIDYKTGHKEFRLSDVTEGINLQMLIYILSICQNGGPHIGDKPSCDLQENSSIQPAGVLYLPARLPVVKVERNADEQTAQREQLRTMRMNGLLLDNPEIVRAMESDAAGLFIPARLGSGGNFLNGSSVASLSQFGKLKKRIEELLCRMAETLRGGDIAAVPAVGSVDACAWCDYRAVCGHEADDPVRRIAEKSPGEVWETLE